MVERLGRIEFGDERGLVVLMHGRKGRKEDLLPVAERFCAVGFVCALPDLPGHGESPVESVGYGVREFERLLAGRVADEAMMEVGQMEQFLWGMSMGGSFVVHAMVEGPERWKRAVIVASFDRLDGVVGDSLGVWSGLVMPILSEVVVWRGGERMHEVRPGELAKGVRVPVFVVHGDKDEFVRFERGQELFYGFTGRKEFLKVEGGNHDNVLVTDAPVYAAMASWLLGEGK